MSAARMAILVYPVPVDQYGMRIVESVVTYGAYEDPI